MEIKPITKEQFDDIKSHRKNSWNDEKIKTMLRETINKKKFMHFAFNLQEFYKSVYNGKTDIKYKDYYCRKHLFENAEIVAKELKLIADVKKYIKDNIMYLAIDFEKEKKE